MTTTLRAALVEMVAASNEEWNATIAKNENRPDGLTLWIAAVRRTAEARARAEIALAATDETEKLHTIVRQAVEAFDSGNLQMSSPEIGEPESGIPMHPWHEEWLHYARSATNSANAS